MLPTNYRLTNEWAYISRTLVAGRSALCRQIEAMAASLAAQQAAHAATERQLIQRLREAEEAARAAVESERNLKVRPQHLTLVHQC